MKKMAKIIALILVLMMIVPTLAMTLSSCSKKDGDGDKGNGNGNGGTSDDGGDDTDGDEITGTDKYTLNIKSVGGLPLEGVVANVYYYKNGELGDYYEDAFGYTDENGVAEIDLPKGSSYAVTLEMPSEGYQPLDYYPLTGATTNISVTSSVVVGEDLPNMPFKVGDIMYDFTVTDINGKKVSIADELKEKDVVILNFWYVDCSACQLEFPFMQTVYESEDYDYSDKVSIIALNPFDDDLSVKSYAGEMGFTFNVAQDTVGAFNAFGVSAYPTSVVIDRYGMISLIEVGALPSIRAFRILFDYFTADNYVQKKISSLEEITPREKPDVEMPSSDAISSALDGGLLAGATYFGDAEDEYSWPFVIDEKDGVACIKTSNKHYDESYAQLFVEVYLEAGEAIAFDYFASTERGADYLYVLVDKKDIFAISGVATSWQTCYAYVAEESGTYEIAFCYFKDGDSYEGDDTVWLKNLRKVEVEDIDSETFIYRFAATNPDAYNVYQSFPELFLNEEDGYYHVDSADGPILLADLMNTTRFSSDNSVYYMVLGKEYEGDVITYCSYASNSQIYGVCPVTEELMALLKTVASDNGATYANEWLEFCCYYDAYGTDKQLSDPIAGLAPFSAYEAIVGDAAGLDAPERDDYESDEEYEAAVNEYEIALNFPNVFEYDRVIMPRGLLCAFTPTVSGTYKISSYSQYDTNAWIFRGEDLLSRTEWLTYDNVYRPNEINPKDVNSYMMAYLEAGVTYYIDIAYYDVYQTGTIAFRLEYLGGEGYFRFSLASPGYFTYYESTGGSVNKIIAGGIDVELDEDGYYREVRTDGRVGSLLYADFTELTTIFDKVIYADDSALPADEKIVDMIEAGAFNFSITENDQFILNYLNAVNGDKDACRDKLRQYWGEDYDEYADLYQLEDVLAGIYHGDGEDYTDEILAIATTKLIKVGTVIGEETIEAGDSRIGCVIVDEELANILQLLMDKYTFEGVENSWTKICYYSQYFCAATPK